MSRPDSPASIMRFAFITTAIALILLTVGLTWVFCSAMDYNEEIAALRCERALFTQECHHRGMELGLLFQFPGVTKVPALCVSQDGSLLRMEIDPETLSLCRKPKTEKRVHP